MYDRENLDLRLIVELAHMYYNSDATQQEIANRYSISRSLVSKYLITARELGLVEIIIHDDKANPYRDIERAVSEKYPDLREVICVDSFGDEESLRNSLGSMASKVLMRIIKPGDKVGISAGTTLLSMAQNVSPFSKLKNVTFIPLAGGLTMDYKDSNSHVICDILAKSTKSKKVEFFAPILLDSEESKEVFLRQPFIRDVIKQAKEVDIAFIGAGEKPGSHRITTAHEEKLLVIKNDPRLQYELAGDISYLFVDKNGEQIDCEWNDRLLGIELKDLKKINTVVLVAGGMYKKDIVESACKSGVTDVLITDVEVAKSLIKEEVYEK